MWDVQPNHDALGKVGKLVLPRTFYPKARFFTQYFVVSCRNDRIREIFRPAMLRGSRPLPILDVLEMIAHSKLFCAWSTKAVEAIELYPTQLAGGRRSVTGYRNRTAGYEEFLPREQKTVRSRLKRANTAGIGASGKDLKCSE